MLFKGVPFNFQKKNKTNFMAPFYGWGSTVPQGWSHFEEAVYFLPLPYLNYFNDKIYTSKL